MVDAVTSPVWPAGKKLLVWSKSAPDFPSGSPAILAELLRHAPPGHVRVVAEDSPLRRQMDIAYPIRRLNIRRMSWPFPRGARVIPWARLLAAFPMTAIGLREVFGFQPSAILTIYFDDAWIISSMLISLLSGAPLIVYVHDPYLENVRAESLARAKLMKWVEQGVMKQSTVVMLADLLSDYYRERHGVSPLVLPHIASGEPLEWSPKPPGDSLIIGVAGSVYGNNVRQMTELAAIVNGDEAFELRLFTPTDPEFLRKHGIAGPRIKVSYIKEYQELLQKLNQCDLLYLPLDSEGGNGLTRENLRLALPTKTVDYLMAGPPQLVHAPGDFQVYQFIQTHHAGHVLDTAKGESLKNWLKRYKAGDIPGIGLNGRKDALDVLSFDRNFKLFCELLEQA